MQYLGVTAVAGCLVGVTLFSSYGLRLELVHGPACRPDANGQLLAVGVKVLVQGTTDRMLKDVAPVGVAGPP
jgi:hypothetical protein